MAPDIIEELQLMAELPPADPDLWKPRFEPGAFNDAHGPLEVEAYKLSNGELKDWASRCVKLRSKIETNADRYVQRAPYEPDQEVNNRSRKGHKKSKTKDNPQGKTLKELREIDAQQEVKGNRAKKRKLIMISTFRDSRINSQ